jgi:hypothetical protein
MAEVTQFCVGLENRPGMLAHLCAVLGQAGVRIDALFVSNDDEGCWVNLIAVPEADADRILRQAGCHFFKERVLAITVDNHPGVLERIASRFAEAGININYVYGSGAQMPNFMLIFNVDDIARAASAVSDFTE